MANESMARWSLHGLARRPTSSLASVLVRVVAGGHGTQRSAAGAAAAGSCGRRPSPPPPSSPPTAGPPSPPPSSDDGVVVGPRPPPSAASSSASPPSGTRWCSPSARWWNTPMTPSMTWRWYIPNELSPDTNSIAASKPKSMSTLAPWVATDSAQCATARTSRLRRTRTRE